MKEILKNLIIKWTKEEALKFHNNDTNIRPNSYIWYNDNRGTFLYKEGSAYYFDNEGIIYKLTIFYTDLDWYKHKKLYDISIKTNSFRMDVPVEHDYIEIKNELHLYTVIHRPTKRLGITFFHKILHKQIDEAYFINFINHASIILPHLRDISYENEGLPVISLPVHKLMFDEHGEYWGDFKSWTMPWETFVSESISMVRDFSKNAGDLLNINLDGIENIAREKWTKI